MNEPIAVMVAGERWFKYFADFTYANKTYSFVFYARNQTEAEEMLRAIRTTAIAGNKIEAEISAEVPGAGIFVKLLCWFRNLIGGES